MQFELKSNKANKKDIFSKGLNGESRKEEKLILQDNSNKQKEITSIGTLCKENFNHREPSSSSTSCDEIKKSNTSVHLIIFTLFVTTYFGRIYAIFLTLLWILLFSIMSKSICRTMGKLFLAGCDVEKQRYNGS